MASAGYVKLSSCLSYFIRQANVKIVESALNRAHACINSTEECDSNENFEKFLKQALLTVTRYMDTRYLIQTTFYVDTIISLSKRANNQIEDKWVRYVTAANEVARSNTNSTIQNIQEYVEKIISNFKLHPDQQPSNFGLAVKTAIEVVSNFQGDIGFGKTDQQAMTVVMHLYHQSYNEYVRLHNKIVNRTIIP